MIKVEILGSGCKKCKTLAMETEKAAKNMGIEIDLIKVTNYEEIMAFNILSTPGLVVNGKVMFSGEVKKAKDIEQYLNTNN